MIHVHDQDFKRLVERAFTESFYTHTSTSPNYQILVRVHSLLFCQDIHTLLKASLDVGRRQVALEGFELVQKHLEKSLIMRKQVAENPELAQYFHFLEVAELIPDEFRQAGMPKDISCYC